MDPMTQANKELAFYKIDLHSDCLGEDGKYGKPGYAIWNKESGIIEHTGMCLPAIIFQAQHFDTTLRGMVELEVEVELDTLPGEDVLIN